jgi:hypothetical protein
VRKWKRREKRRYRLGEDGLRRRHCDGWWVATKVGKDGRFDRQGVRMEREKEAKKSRCGSICIPIYL